MTETDDLVVFAESLDLFLDGKSHYLLNGKTLRTNSEIRTT